jgi:3',5'-cyclic AMP phosphodiesterase CpdA
MGAGGAPGDGRRLVEAIRQTNAIRPDFVLVSGDLTHRRDQAEYDWLAAALHECAAPYHLIPGNHDIVEVNDREGLERFRKRFGADSYGFAAEGWEFICLNSMLLDTPNAAEPAMRDESQRQWRWLAHSLKRAAESGNRVIIHMHVPPFVDHPDEAPAYFNLPLEARRRLLALVTEHGVPILLTGHTHTTTERRGEGFILYTVSGSAVALDERGLGYRVFLVEGDAVHQRFVPLASTDGS